MIGKSNSSGGSNFFMDDVKTKVREVKLSTNIMNPEVVTYGNSSSSIKDFDVSAIEYHGLLYILFSYDSNNVKRPRMISYDGTTFTVIHDFTDVNFNYYSMAILDGVIHCFLSEKYQNTKKHFTFDGETLTEISDFPPSGYPSTTVNNRGNIVSYNEKLYYFCVGGYMYVYDGNAWTQLGSEHMNLKLYSYCVYDRYIYCISSTGNLYKYDGTTFSLVCSITLEDTYPLLFGFNGRLFLFSKTKVYVLTGSSFHEVYFEYNSNISQTQYGHIVCYKDKILIMHMMDLKNLLEYEVFYSLEMK